jgi:phage regulator Rha-like protein
MTCSFLEQALLDANATISASNAHCTIMKRAESDAQAELQNKKNKGRRTVKTTARYVAHDTMRELHASQAQEKARRASEAVEKEAQKAEEEAAHEARIQEDIKTKVFTGASSSFDSSLT